MSLLEVKNLKKVYTTRLGGNKVQALDNVNFSVEQGEYVAIMGESGSGKTTLLNIMASLDRPTAGQVILSGRDMAEIRQKDLCAFRRDNLGFVFQDFNLLDTLTIEENIGLALTLGHGDAGAVQGRVREVAGELGIGLNKKSRCVGNCYIEDESAFTTFHIGMGRNLALGGVHDAAGHFDLVFQFPTIYADDILIMKDGFPAV